MIKRTLLLSGLTFSTLSAQNEYYTFVFSNVKNIDNANYFINKYLKDKKDVNVLPYNGRYRVIYGKFETKKKAYLFKHNLSYKLKNLKPFVVSLKNIEEEKKQKTFAIEEKVEKIEKKELLVEDSNEKLTKLVQKKEIIIPEIKKENELVLGINLEYSLQKNKEKFTYGSTDKIDSKDLGSYENTNAYTPTIYLKNGNHKFYISYFYENNDFNKTNSKDINFDGYIYTSNSNLKINEETKWLIGGYKYLYKDLAFGFDVHNYNSELNFSSSTNSANLKKEYTFPSISVDLNHKINSLLINYGASYGAKSNELDYYTYYLGLGIDDFVFNNTSMNIGYKSKTIDVKEDKYDGKKEYSGLYMNINKEF